MANTTERFLNDIYSLSLQNENNSLAMISLSSTAITNLESAFKDFRPEIKLIGSVSRRTNIEKTSDSPMDFDIVVIFENATLFEQLETRFWDTYTKEAFKIVLENFVIRVNRANKDNGFITSIYQYSDYIFTITILQPNGHSINYDLVLAVRAGSIEGEENNPNEILFNRPISEWENSNKEKLEKYWGTEQISYIHEPTYALTGEESVDEICDLIDLDISASLSEEDFAEIGISTDPFKYNLFLESLDEKNAHILRVAIVVWKKFNFQRSSGMISHIVEFNIFEFAMNKLFSLDLDSEMPCLDFLAQFLSEHENYDSELLLGDDDFQDFRTIILNTHKLVVEGNHFDSLMLLGTLSKRNVG